MLHSLVIHPIYYNTIPMYYLYLYFLSPDLSKSLNKYPSSQSTFQVSCVKHFSYSTCAKTEFKILSSSTLSSLLLHQWLVIFFRSNILESFFHVRDLIQYITKSYISILKINTSYVQSHYCYHMLKGTIVSQRIYGSSLSF